MRSGADGVEDGATRRALRHFERAHGLIPTTKISSELLKQLTAAARPGAGQGRTAGFEAVAQAATADHSFKRPALI